MLNKTLNTIILIQLYNTNQTFNCSSNNLNTFKGLEKKLFKVTN